MRPTTRSSLSARSRIRRGLRRGFALAEVVVALGLLSIGLLALAGTTAGVLREETSARAAARAASILAARRERGVGARCRDSAGAGATEGVHETWRIAAADDVMALADTARYAVPGGIVVTGLEAATRCVP